MTRAITLAFNESYYRIQERLRSNSDLFECDTLYVGCYSHLLDDVHKLHRVYGVEGMPISDFLYTHPKGTYLIRVDQHLTCARDGIIYDIWDCTDEIIDIVWEVTT